MHSIGHFEPPLGKLEPRSTRLSMSLVRLLKAAPRLLSAFLHSHRWRFALWRRRHLLCSVSGEPAIHQIPRPHDVTIVTKRHCFYVPNDIVIMGVPGRQGLLATSAVWRRTNKKGAAASAGRPVG